MSREINGIFGGGVRLTYGTFNNWKSINWTQVENEVKKLQVRIAKATEERKFGKVKSLQWILTHSFYAKLLAIKRVTENPGAKTPGVDGEIWKTDKQKYLAISKLKRRGYTPLPLRRIYIPKSNGKFRPLGIPTIKSRAMQALYKLGLEPVAETLACKNSYGFRPLRSATDAIEQCFKIFGKKRSSKWILEGDIKSCFDNISHQWLLDNIPMDRSMLKRWLSCGYMDQGELFSTDVGTPQGGVISPTLLILTMSSLEKEIKAKVKKAEKVNIVTYADDFIVSGATKEILINKIKPIIENFLAKRGLKLSNEKTLITNIDEGFDFLGFNLRKYSNKLIIKPSKKSIKSFLRKVRKVIKKNKTAKTENLIIQINPKVIGWGYYFRTVCSKGTFEWIDHSMFRSIWNWAKRRHKNHGERWVYRKYFVHPFLPSGTFHAKASKENKCIRLLKMSSIKIRRHVKIKGDANPYNPKYESYLTKLFNRRRIISKDMLPIF